MIYTRKIKGFRDIDNEQNALRWHIIQKATEIYKKYGFEHWDTPILEYAETLGKYLPDADQLAQGVYSFKNPETEPIFDSKGREKRDEQDNVIMTNHYLTLRYDHTAPLARLYSELVWQKYYNNQLNCSNAELFRRYQFGPVFRFEAKLDPGRFREFWQLDFDTVGSDALEIDAENCMILSDALENIGIERGMYVVKLNNRKVIKGLFQFYNISNDIEVEVMRIIDKLDKIGIEGVGLELGNGRKDNKSGAFIAGIGLAKDAIDAIVNFISGFDTKLTRKKVLEILKSKNINSQLYNEGIEELSKIDNILSELGYNEQRVIIDPSMIRGMGYYTGPIFEVEYLGTYIDSKGQERRVGSICGGGRYDGLVENLIGVRIPASGASIGVDRLAEILTLTGKMTNLSEGPIFIANFDDKFMDKYQKIAMELRNCGFEVEIYFGVKKGLKHQLAYADKKNCSIAIIIGEDEIAKNIATVRNLRLGKKIADQITDKNEWAELVQRQVPLNILTNFLKYIKFDTDDNKRDNY